MSKPFRWWTKTTLANVISGVCIILGMGYFICTKNTEGVMFIVGGCIGYLFGRQARQQQG